MLPSSFLWRLPVLGVDLSGAGAKDVEIDMQRVFERDSFLASLTEAEREMRLPSEDNRAWRLRMSPRRPHLLRAHYDWILENELTPHLVVDVNVVGVQVPMEYAHDGQIVLNISPFAVSHLELMPHQATIECKLWWCTS